MCIISKNQGDVQIYFPISRINNYFSFNEKQQIHTHALYNPVFISASAVKTMAT